MNTAICSYALVPIVVSLVLLVQNMQYHSDTSAFDDWNSVSLRQNCNTVSHVNVGSSQTVHTQAMEYVVIEVMNESDWEAHAIMHENFGYPN